MSVYDRIWYVSGSGFASGQGWAQPTLVQREFIKTVFGVK
ncbi:hypothetical protein FHS14_000302 [Paenibacillus baekrokdamisoli]|nr:hypothetical protein [Paenibacillus baekrokdamisoli]